MTGTVSIAFQSDKGPDEYAALAVAAESYGFDGISVFGDLGYQPPLYPLLAMARATSRVRLGAACLNPYLTHPVEIAGQVAALDAASDGRAYLGLARGSWLSRVGVAQDRPLATLREAAEVVAALLAGDDSGYPGEVFRIEPGTTLRYAPRRATVDLLLGVWGPRGARLAAGIADEVKLGGSANPDMVATMRRWLAGPREVGVVAGAVTVVDEDRTAARRRARGEVAMYLDVVARLDPTVAVDPALLSRLGALVAASAYDRAGALIGDDLLDRFCFAGTPDEVAERAAALIDAGASRIEFGTPHGLTDSRGVDLLGAEVLPRIRCLVGD
ncbi:MAG TPA: LLM class flavin-dependent oxidoreductase [Actinocatenispora sp.]